MNSVFTAPRAIFLDLHAIGHGGLVLGGRIVAALALSARKSN